MNVLIGVTGGIAAYKAASVVSVLVDLGRQVKVIMTENAKHFVQPLTFSALSHNEVYGDHNRFAADGHIHHIELAEWADVFCIVPATFNTILKIHQGVTDNLLTSTVIPYIPTGKPFYLCPAMNSNMWTELQRRGLNMDRSFIGPEKGKMACGSVGMGKLAQTRTIVNTIIAKGD